MQRSFTIQERSTLEKNTHALIEPDHMLLRDRIARFFFFFFLTSSLFLFAEEEKKEVDGYTINYNTISIVEYVKFASKICNTNFIFNEEELNFTVSVVSDAPITAQNVMATLIQVLRVHGMNLLEQGNSLVIHKADGVSQIAKLVTEAGQEGDAPIVTRIFRMKNTKVESVAAVIQPMISSTSILEASPETRQLILTDVTANVDKVAALIEILDSPHTPLDIQSFEVTHNKPEFLIDLASQIMNPITQGYPFILVSQPLANQIFVVSSPELVERTTAVLKTLDTPPKVDLSQTKKVKGENILVYKVENSTGSDILLGLHNIGENLAKSGSLEGDLIETIDSGRWIKETNTLMFVGSKESLAKVQEFLPVLDVQTGKASGKEGFFVYRPQHKTAGEVEKAILEMGKNLKEGVDAPLLETIENVKVNPLTQTLVFSGDESTFPRVKELLATIDASNGRPTRPAPSNNFYIYKIQHGDPEEVELGLKSFASNLNKSNAADEALIDAIQGMKYIKESNSILFTGAEPALKRVEEIAPLFDLTAQKKVSTKQSSQFLIYKPKYVRGEQLVRSLKEITEKLQGDKEFADPDLLHTLQSMQWVKSTESLLITGDGSSLKKINDLIGTVDVPGAQLQEPKEKTFFLFQPKYASKQKVESYLKQLAGHLNKKGEEDLIETIRSMKWIDPSQSFMFQGTPSSASRLQTLLKDFDNPDTAKPPISHKSFFIYHLTDVQEGQMDQYLEQVAANLKKTDSDPDLIDAIRSRKWIEDSQSFMFQGTDPALAELKDLLKTFDRPSDIKTKQKSGYFLYKVQNTSGDVIEDDLDNLAKNFKSSGYKDKNILDVIDHIRYVKETNSLLLTGDPKAIEEVKEIIAGYDVPRQKGPDTSQFLMYKPLHVPAQQIEGSLKDIGENLKKADLADPNLLQAIASAKYVDTTNSLIFTGSPDSLQKIETLIKDIDLPPQKHAPIQKIGKTTFLLYKLKYASGPQITTAIKSMTNNLKKAGAPDKEFVSALQSMRFIKETNSLMFTGTEEALSKVETLVEQFDVTSLAPEEKIAPPQTGPSNFYVYKPQSLSGPDLEKILQDFEENLKLSGLFDPELFQAIDSMRYVDKTQSLVFTGSKKALDQIKELLVSFDIPSNLPQGPIPTGPLEPSIQAIDNTSFLVYKLQFHKGDEIQGALRQIAKDLILSNAPVNQNLLNSINSIQWLEVTNSLLCSGDQETLVRLKELIKNLDIPLKQVFIEMLVIETTLTNALTFGLEWGGNYKYRNKFGGSMFNTLPSTTGTCTPDTFVSNLASRVPSATNPPTPVGNIPPGCGFDLGVIGQVIKHNGDTFLTLGSLLQALQTDQESTVLMMPKILTQDGRTSTNFVGRNIPFFGSLISNVSQNTLNTTNIEYRDIGLNLTVTPVLGNSDIVTLDISLERTQQLTDATGSTITISNTTATAPTTSKTTMQTTVHVPDKSFLILSGFVDSSNTKSKSGIPCLGGLPVVGAAFSKANDTVSNSNIVIFLRPHIITSVDDMKRVSEEQEEFFRDQMGTPYLEHNFDEAMELIKSIDDE